ncbi:MAG: S41 family peptidase [Sphingobium sp.]
MIRRAAIFAMLAACAVASPATGAPGNAGRSEISKSLKLIGKHAVDPVDAGKLASDCVEAMRLRPATAAAATNTATDNAAAINANAASARDVTSPMAVFDRLRAAGDDERELVRACVEAMLQQTGRAGRYIDIESERRMQARGPAGLGLTIAADQGLPYIVDLTPGGPAEAGLRKDDRILFIDGQPTQGMTLDEVIRLARGADGSVASLTVKRGDTAPFDLSLTRSLAIEGEPRSWVDEGIGIIRITRFAPRTADLFVEKGVIVTNQGRAIGDVERWYAKPGDMTNGLPLSMLMDGNTGGGALILASALKLYRGARLIGRTTVGPPFIRSLLLPSDRIALEVTTSRLILADGATSGAPGIAPDIEIPAEDEADTARDALARAIALLSAAHQAAGAE